MIEYLKEKRWHGLSCSCGGGYRVGHAIGCPYATAADNLAQLHDDLARARDYHDAAEIADLERIKAEIEALPDRYPGEG